MQWLDFKIQKLHPIQYIDIKINYNTNNFELMRYMYIYCCRYHFVLIILNRKQQNILLH